MSWPAGLPAPPIPSFEFMCSTKHGSDLCDPKTSTVAELQGLGYVYCLPEPYDWFRNMFENEWKATPTCGPKDSGVHHDNCPFLRSKNRKIKRGPKPRPSTDRPSCREGLATKMCPWPGCEDHLVSRWTDIERHLLIHLPPERQPYQCLWDGCGAVHSQERNFLSHFQKHLDSKTSIHEGWDNWCGLEFPKGDTIRLCKYRCNDINHLQRHRNGSDRTGRHSGHNIRFGPPPPQKHAKKAEKRSYKKVMLQDVNGTDALPELVFVPSKLTQKAQMLGTQSPSSPSIPPTLIAAPLRWKNAMAPPRATVDASVVHTEDSLKPPFIQCADQSLSPPSYLSPSMPPSPTLSTVSEEPPASSSPSESGTSENWLTPYWLPEPPRSSNYTGGLTGAFSIHPSDMPSSIIDPSS